MDRRRLLPIRQSVQLKAKHIFKRWKCLISCKKTIWVIENILYQIYAFVSSMAVMDIFKNWLWSPSTQSVTIRSSLSLPWSDPQNVWISTLDICTNYKDLKRKMVLVQKYISVSYNLSYVQKASEFVDTFFGVVTNKCRMNTNLHWVDRYNASNTLVPVINRDFTWCCIDVSQRACCPQTSNCCLIFQGFPMVTIHTRLTSSGK